MKFYIIFIFLISNQIYAQYEPKYDEYKHFSIFKKRDTINYHVYTKDSTKKDGIILFINGSGAEPLFTIKQEGNNMWINSSIPFDLNKIPSNYIFVLVSKKCLPFSVINKDFKTPNCFFENEGLDYRVWQNDIVIKNILQKHIKNPKKIIVIGHSEGSDVVAKLGTINKKITHIGYWSGGGNTQFYDFALFIRKEVSEGKIDEKTASVKLDSLFNQIKDIELHPNSISKTWEDNSYRRWSEFSEPSIDNLVKINIPIFVALGAKDKSVPVESGLLIPVEFYKRKKQNLTFRLYPNYEHSFYEIPKNENKEWIPHWMDVFDEFMKWTDK